MIIITEKIINYDALLDNITKQIRGYFLRPDNINAKAVIGISGGKDSSVAAALLVRAIGEENVICVKMPQGEQKDICDANHIIRYLNIPAKNIYEINIGNTVDILEKELADESVAFNDVLTNNLPARIRMTTLYAVAASCHGRVINTCNYSEDYVGYATKYGDNAGDFAILQEFTVSEILKIGEALGLPDELIYKTPSDGLCGKSDEENLGFSYSTLDKYVIGEEIDFDTQRLIESDFRKAAHKINITMPQVRRQEYDKNIYEG